MHSLEAVLLTGVYGVGKSTVVEEMSEQLEAGNVPYAAIDVDWLWWFDVPGLPMSRSREILLDNLKSLVGNYIDAGVRRLLLAWTVKDAGDLELIRAALDCPLRVIRLTAPKDVVRQRLAESPTVGRTRDADNTETMFRESIGLDNAEAEIVNEGPVGDVARAVLQQLNWRSEFDKSDAVDKQVVVKALAGFPVTDRKAAWTAAYITAAALVVLLLLAYMLFLNIGS